VLEGRRGQVPSPASRAAMMAWARSATCSLVKMFETLLRTVCRTVPAVWDLRVCQVFGHQSQDAGLAGGQLREGIAVGRLAGVAKNRISRCAIAGPKIASPSATAPC
jgi:hypothetical protein